MPEEREPQTHRCENLKISITLQLRESSLVTSLINTQHMSNIPENLLVYIITKWKVIKPETLDSQTTLMWLLARETVVLRVFLPSSFE